MPETDLTRDQVPLTGTRDQAKQPRTPARDLPSRLTVSYPAWIDRAMKARWAFIIAFGLVAASLPRIDDGPSWTAMFVWWGGIALFMLVPWVSYRLYKRKSPVEAEIVFYNEKDGYGHSDGDDGDGDGD